ncbi:GtrA family protein, partial [Candidatus Pelagibacter sp.]|uniref:GtrA family protein n=1 Tax=Candidatus Pelagibacter sp. TaxID=2024849 RepID=UPI003F84191D
MSKNLFKLLIKYFFIGILAASIELLIFSFFTKYLNYVIANSIAYSFGIITSFTLNKFYNFKVKDKTIIRFGRFLIVNISGL